MSGFSRHKRSGAIFATFSIFEADLLRSLAAQLVELLRSDDAAQVEVDPFEALLDFSGPTRPPEDPVLARLLPTAYSDDEDAAADFRRFTEKSLRHSKAAGATTIIETLEEAGLPAEPTDDALMIDVEMDRPVAMAWLRSFTDIRLALATRLGIEDGDDEFWAGLPEDDPMAQAHDIYDWVGYLQETLVGALGG